jgi:anti-anti-sigma factor
MEIKTSVVNGRVPITVLAVSGNVDTGAFEVFMSKAQEALDNGARYILVDMTNVPYMSSAGLRVLNALFNRLRVLNSGAIADSKSPYLKVLNLSKMARLAFETAGFDELLETYSDMQAAIASF